MTGAFRKVAGLGLTGYGAANLWCTFNTLSSVSAGAYAAGTLIGGGFGVLALGIGLKLLSTDGSKNPSPA